MKICILGNSHSASLKNAWDEISIHHPGFELIFFASRAKGLAGLRLENKQLLPQTPSLAANLAFTSDGLDRVDLESYDLFLIYGLDLGMPELDFCYSSAVKKQACLDTLSNSLNIRICEIIRSASDRPIYIGHNPQRATPDLKAASRIEKINYQQTLTMMNDELKIERATIVPQPEETLSHQWFTDMRFSIGSTRLDVGDEISGQLHPELDCMHMNKEFGKVWLDQFFRMLAKGIDDESSGS